MSLKHLLEQNLLKKIDPVSIGQIRKRFGSAMAYFSAARSLFDAPGTDESFNRVVYTNLYNVVRILGETLLLLNGFKATIDQHHKTVILASKLLMNDEKMETVFARLDRMRKNRNTIDYDLDALDVSAQTIKQAMTDTEQFASKVELLISKKEGQHKLQL